MTFAKWVKKYQTVFLGSLVAIMVLSLIVWIPGVGGSSDKEEKLAGEFKDRSGRTVEVKQSEYDYYEVRYHIIHKALPWIEELLRNTWEYIIMLNEADLYKIYVEEQEIRGNVIGLIQSMTRRQFNFQDYNAILYGLGTTPEMFESCVTDIRRINKLLYTLSEAQFTTYNDTFTDFVSNYKYAKIRYCPLDHEDFTNELKPPKESEIADYFEKNKDKFKVDEKIQIDYIIAEFEQFKKDISEPTEDEMKKHYNENMQQYEVVPPQGQSNAQQKFYKPFEEVKKSIADAIKLNKAEGMAIKSMEQVNLDIGNALQKSKDSYISLKDIAEKYNIRYGITPFFDRERVNDIEKVVGNNAHLRESGFILRKNELSDMMRTTRGCIIYRLLDKKEAYTPQVLIDDIRDNIVKHLNEEHKKQLARQRAIDIAGEISKNGCNSVEKKYNLHLKAFGYFDKDGKSDKSGGDEESAPPILISRALSLKPGQASEVDAGDLSYVLYVDDIVSATPQDFERKFDEVYKQKLYETRFKKRSAIKDEVIKYYADLKDYTKKEKKEAEHKSQNK